MCFILQVNHTFDFVGKLKTLSETLLSASSIFQSSGNGQMLHQLQVRGGPFATKGWETPGVSAKPEVSFREH